ncbi:hypothetical protein SCUP234_02862 [Seiridium cupressi]
MQNRTSTSSATGLATDSTTNLPTQGRTNPGIHRRPSRTELPELLALPLLAALAAPQHADNAIAIPSTAGPQLSKLRQGELTVRIASVDRSRRERVRAVRYALTVPAAALRERERGRYPSSLFEGSTVDPFSHVAARPYTAAQGISPDDLTSDQRLLLSTGASLDVRPAATSTTSATTRTTTGGGGIRDIPHHEAAPAGAGGLEHGSDGSALAHFAAQPRAEPGHDASDYPDANAPVQHGAAVTVPDVRRGRAVESEAVVCRVREPADERAARPAVGDEEEVR